MQESVLFPGRDKSKEKFVWRATYKDDSIINNRENATYTKIEDLSRDGLRWFEILENDTCLLKVQILPGDTFSYRKRTAIKAGQGMLARYYIVRIKRWDTFDHYFLDEETKAVSIIRFKDGEDMSGWMYGFSPVENDDVLVS